MPPVKTRFPDYLGWLPPDPRVRNKFMKDVLASISSHRKNISAQGVSVVSKFSGLQIVAASSVDPPVDPPVDPLIVPPVDPPVVEPPPPIDPPVVPPVVLPVVPPVVDPPPPVDPPILVDPPVDPPVVDPPPPVDPLPIVPGDPGGDPDPGDDDVGPAPAPPWRQSLIFKQQLKRILTCCICFKKYSDRLVPNFQTFLGILTILIGQPPPYIHGEDADGPFDGPIGVPIYCFFDLLSNTFAALELFRMPAFNNALRALLNFWGDFLRTPASNVSLNQNLDGWFGNIGIRRLAQPLCTNRAPDAEATLVNAFEDAPPGLNIVQFSRTKFVETFEVPNAGLPNYGFLSWDAFFTRRFNAGVRPIVPPVPLDGVPIYSPCESAIFRIAPNVRWNDKFWIKETQPYSVRNMLIPEALANNNGYANFVSVFENGTVYQAFLSPYNYHRWHSPITGTIVKIVKIPGSYYAVLPDNEAEAHGAIIRSQAFLTISATRLLIYIRSIQNPDLMICFIAVGMVEVSTCEVTVNNGGGVIPGVAEVNANNFANVDVNIDVVAGQELGTFHFGGSSSVILFSGGFNFQPTVGVIQPGVGEPPNHIWLSTHIGNVVPV